MVTVPSAPTATELKGATPRLARTPGVKVNLTKLGREKLVQAALGLTSAQAQRVSSPRRSWPTEASDHRDIELVTAEKKQVIRESEDLEFYPVQETAAMPVG